jgi:hypothetical protein
VSAPPRKEGDPPPVKTALDYEPIDCATNSYDLGMFWNLVEIYRPRSRYHNLKPKEGKTPAERKERKATTPTLTPTPTREEEVLAATTPHATSASDGEGPKRRKGGGKPKSKSKPKKR